MPTILPATVTRRLLLARGREDESGRGATGKRGSADRESGDLAGEAEGAKHGGDGRSLPPATDAQTGRAEKDSSQAFTRMSVNNLPDP